jgi:hypothetical protein
MSETRNLIRFVTTTECRGGGCLNPPNPPLSARHCNFLFSEYRGYLQGLKWPRREVNRSPLSSAEVKNEWRYTCTPRICLDGVDGENQRMNIRGGIQNIPDWCRHLYSRCGSPKHGSKQAKLGVSGSTATFCGDCVKTSPRTLTRTDLAALP